MKKINHFSVNEIFKKRRLTTLIKKQQKFIKQKSIQQGSLDEDHQIDENEIIFNVMQTINEKGIQFVSNSMKIGLINLISKKTNLSLNSGKILPKMKLRKIKNIQVIEKLFINSKRKQFDLRVSNKKLDHSQSASTLNDQRKSYFLLTGSMFWYQQVPENHNNSRLKSNADEQISNETFFFNYKQFEIQYPNFKRVKQIPILTGFGPVFDNKNGKADSLDKFSPNFTELSSSKMISSGHKLPELILAQESVLVQIQNPQFQNEYINLNGIEYEKIGQILESFPIFRSLGKKIKNFVPFFQLKEYKKNQQIYTIGQKVEKFYLILKGQIVFEYTQSNSIKSAASTPMQNRKASISGNYTIKTETLSPGNYFGQEQILFELSQRFLSANCKSSKCELLEISKDKFQRMLDYSDFHEIVKVAADTKYKQRMLKFEKNKKIRSKFSQTQYNQEKSQKFLLSTQRPSPAGQKAFLNFFPTPKASLQGKFKIMHGNVIRKFNKQQQSRLTEDIEFSMLSVDQTAFKKSSQKFKKYSVKSPQRYKPQISWDLKRVWKVLNLQQILRQDAQVGSPQGRKYYDSHKRYMCQLNQSKSLRPKTSSSTYRTKLQYIAFLQQFKSKN